jgi:hypothetical protein
VLYIDSDFPVGDGTGDEVARMREIEFLAVLLG